MEWLLGKNPLLALKLRAFEGDAPLLVQEEIESPENAEVIYIKGVKKIPPQKADVVFIEEDIAKIYALLQDKEVVLTERVHIIEPSEQAYASIIPQFAFKPSHFIGELTDLQKSIDTHHMILSDYRDLGHRILGNFRSNLRAGGVIDGRRLRNRYKGKKCIVCGSGPSLEKELPLLRRGEYTVIATGSSLAKLLEEEIFIDIGVYIDPKAPMEQYQNLNRQPFPLFYQNRICRDFFAFHKGEKVWMGTSEGWPVEDWLLQNMEIEPWRFDAGWNAGCFGFHIAKFLGFSEIRLAGIDGGREEEKTGEWITRRDLHYGLEWITQFEEELATPVYPKEERIYPKESEAYFANFYDQEVIAIIDRFLKALEKGEDWKKEHLFFEIDLEERPFYVHWGKFLHKLFAPLYLKGESEVEKSIAKALFLKRAFAAKNETVRYTHKNGTLSAIESFFDGKREGEWKRFSPAGELISSASYLRGELHGQMRLYREGQLIREGEYEFGKKVGKHTLYHYNGKPLLEGEFSLDEPYGFHRRYDEQGGLIEERYYHTPKQFDRREYINGTLHLQGLFCEEGYIEERFKEGAVVERREGEWKGDRLVWR